MNFLSLNLFVVIIIIMYILFVQMFILFVLIKLKFYNVMIHKHP